MRTKHLTQEECIGYINQILDDAHREIMDTHLLDCQICRANMHAHEVQNRQISNELNAVLKTASPSQHMNFSEISPFLRTERTRQRFWPRLTAVIPATIALIGLLFSALGVWQVVSVKIIHPSVHSLGAFPPLACFFLMLASVGQYDRMPPLHFRSVLTWTTAIILWLGSILIGLLDLIVIRDLSIMTVIALGGNLNDATPIAMIAVMIGSLCYIAIIFGGGEYHYRNIGQPGSWKLFTITILGQLFILMIPYLLW